MRCPGIIQGAQDIAENIPEVSALAYLMCWGADRLCKMTVTKQRRVTGTGRGKIGMSGKASLIGVNT